MKNLRNSIIAIALLLVINNAMAATVPFIYVTGDKTFVLNIQTPASALTIRFADDNNFGLYKKKVKVQEVDYKQLFDLNALPNGTYKLEIEDISRVFSVTVVIAEDKIVSNEITKEETLKPIVFNLKGNLLVKGFATAKQPIAVAIYDDEQGLIHSEELTDEAEQGRLYKFKHSGDFSIVLESKGKTYSHSVSVTIDPATKEQTLTINK